MADLKYTHRFANLNRLSTEQLEELLRTAPLLPDSQETSDYYDAIEAVIVQRETEHPTGRIQDIDRAWAEFQEHYFSPASESAEMPPEESGEILTPSIKENGSYAKKPFRKVLPIAAAIAVIFMSMIAAQAAGVDVFGALAHWTEETFHFNGGGSGGKTLVGETARPQIEDETYLAIQAEVDKLGIDIPVVPTWFPVGYELEEILLPNPDITAWQDIDCCFRNQDGQTFFLTIAKYIENYDISSIVFEKDGQPVSQYLCNGKLFYLMSNNSRKRGVWSNGYIVLSIDGSLSEETIKTIIDSIGGEESENAE